MDIYFVEYDEKVKKELQDFLSDNGVEFSPNRQLLIGKEIDLLIVNEDNIYPVEIKKKLNKKISQIYLKEYLGGVTQNCIKIRIFQ